MFRSSLHRPASLAAIGALLLTPLLGAPLPTAHAEGSKEDKIAERDQIEQDLEDLRLELDGVNSDLADTYLALAETELLIPQAQQDLDDAQAELEAAREEDRETGERLTAAQDEEKELTGEVEEGQVEVDRSDEELAEVALSAYKGTGMPSPASVYVGGQSPQETVDRTVNYRLTLASQGTRLDTLRTDQAVTEGAASRLTAVREEIAALKIEAEEAVERTEQAEEDAAAAKSELDDLYAQQLTQSSDLETKKAQYETDQSTLETRSSTLDTEIEELAREEKRREEERLAREREEREKANQQSTASSSSGSSSSGSSGSSSSSDSGWVRPVSVRLNSNFGWRVHPIYGTRRLHAGVDFPAACGTAVGATHSGRVIQRTYNSGAGNKIVLSHGIHNGKLITSSYHHLQGFALPVGANVSAGQTVGYVGTTGSSTGCHLHFEIHEDGNAVNPTNYV